MRCDVLAVGTELLLGQISNTNAAEIGAMLAADGIDSFEHVTVGDNIDRIAVAMHEALEKADALIVTGGLGPTHDDITREAIANVMGVGLVLDEKVASAIKQIFEERHREMVDNNLRQAMVPVGAAVIEQVLGTAPGLICPIGTKVIYLLPGVPSEMREMMQRAVMPDLRKRNNESGVISSVMIRTVGIAESTLAELLQGHIDSLDKSKDATIAFLASSGRGVGIRITTKASEKKKADRTIANQVQKIYEIAGEWIYGKDDDTLESVIADLANEKRVTIGVAESVTGGMICSRLVSSPEASTWFRGGIVSYASDLKFSLLGVPDGPVVTESAAAAMAEGVCKTLQTDVGLSTTGVAGPTEQEGQPVGTVFVGVCIKGETKVEKLELGTGRERVRELATMSSLDLLRRRLYEL